MVDLVHKLEQNMPLSFLLLALYKRGFNALLVLKKEERKSK